MVTWVFAVSRGERSQQLIKRMICLKKTNHTFPPIILWRTNWNKSRPISIMSLGSSVHINFGLISVYCLSIRYTSWLTLYYNIMHGLLFSIFLILVSNMHVLTCCLICKSLISLFSHECVLTLSWRMMETVGLLIGYN